MKKMGVLLPTQSQLPSFVYIFTAKPLGSRAVSALPDSPPSGKHRQGVGRRGEEGRRVGKEGRGEEGRGGREGEGGGKEGVEERGS